MEQDPHERERYLCRLLAQLFAAHEELMRSNPPEDPEGYAEKLNTVYRLKDEYKRHTGTYPHVPPYDTGLSSGPGT